jgi:holliday junction DNA helicase RuvB
MKNIEIFNDFVGNDDVKAMLKEAIESAKYRNTRLDHILVTSESGCGKTTLSRIIAHEMNVPYETVLCGDRGVGKLNIKLMKMEDKSILILDEIHLLDKNLMTSTFSYFDRGEVQFIFPGKPPVVIKAKDITIIGLTTNPEKLLLPFSNRFNMHIRLLPYTEDDLYIITKRNAQSEGLNLTDSAIKIISLATKGIPRDGENIIRRVRDHVRIHYDNYNEINDTITLNALSLMGIDHNGLNALDRQYIKTIFEVFNNETVGKDSLAMQLQVDEDTMIRQVETYLLKSNIIGKSKQGRYLQTRGMELAVEYSQ